MSLIRYEYYHHTRQIWSSFRIADFKWSWTVWFLIFCPFSVSTGAKRLWEARLSGMVRRRLHLTATCRDGQCILLHQWEWSKYYDLRCSSRRVTGRCEWTVARNSSRGCNGHDGSLPIFMPILLQDVWFDYWWSVQPDSLPVTFRALRFRHIM